MDLIIHHFTQSQKQNKKIKNNLLVHFHMLLGDIYIEREGG
jgi:hypothetical protein